MKTVVIGVLPQERIRARMLAIAKGTLKPKSGEPKVWFTSMRSLAEVLSDENRALLRLIAERRPESVSELAMISGRKQGNLSRTLNTMRRYGLVEMKRNARLMRPVAKAYSFRIVA